MTAGGDRRGHPACLRHSRRILAYACVAAICSTTLLAQIKATYLYSLSTFAGPLRYDWVRLQVDKSSNETFVIYQNVVRVFNATGMEIFSFGDDVDVGQIADVAADVDGSILLLSYKDSKPLVTRCNYRGIPITTVEIRKVPSGLAFHPNRLLHLEGRYYFVSLATASVIVTDSQGEFRSHLDLLAGLPEDEKQKTGAEMSGVTVDEEGNIYFTVATLFRVYKYSADGAVTFFGTPGSAAGKFGVIAGIATDSRGNILVADKLKCVVMVFDKDFKFLAEFGYRGARPENLILPDEIAIDSKDRLYVSQARRRGISVFALNP